MTDDNTNWRTPNFRQNVAQKINEAILSTGTSSSRNAIEMEAHAFQKAKNKDEYLAFTARLILYIKEMDLKNKNIQNIGDVNNTGGPGMTDLINALQNMTPLGTRNPQMMGMSGAGPAEGGNMGVGGNIPASNLLQTLTQQRPGQQNPQQQQINQQNMGCGGPMINQVGGPLQCNNMPGQQRGVVGGCIGMAPSPSSAGQPDAVASPLNPQEEQLYREKYQQLTKYIEPLKLMIARMGNDDIEKRHKMNRLLDILCNPSIRTPLETLVKCEKALEKMDFKSN